MTRQIYSMVRTGPTSAMPDFERSITVAKVLHVPPQQRSVRRRVSWHGYQVLPLEYWAGPRSAYIERTYGRISRAAGCCRTRQQHGAVLDTPVGKR